VSSNSPRIEVKDLEKTYFHEGREIPVLCGVNLVIESGDMISVTGASGVGKTTLLHVLGTLDVPTGGTLQFDDIDPFSLSDRKRASFRRRNVGFVFQFHHLMPQFTALENVMMPARIDRQSLATSEKKARELLDRMGLNERIAHRPSELSGGEQQRVAVARALIMAPNLILADEPTGNLDIETGEGIHDLIVEVNRDFGTSMLVVTHNPALADSMPRKMKMENGVLVEDNS
jgi:lipoprotein-releasing system ATP-binding protein